MKFHTQNVWTSKPTIMVNLDPSEIANLRKELDAVFEHCGCLGSMEALAAFDDMLNRAQLTAAPKGLKK